MARGSAQSALPGVKTRGKNVLGKHAWTAAQHSGLRDMYARGDAAKSIAVHFGVTERAVLGQALKLGLRHKSKAASLADRFEEQIVSEPNSGCLLWLGALSSTGRPSIRVGTKTVTGTRAAFHLAGIEIPNGACVLHRCDNPICVNTEHLYFGTRADNARDARGHKLPGLRISPDECVKGHSLVGDNLVIYSGGQRVCRECRNSNARLWRARQP